MKFIKLLTLLVLFSLHAGATGYSHNMFVAHKKLQAGKESRITSDQTLLKKAGSSRHRVKHTSMSRTEVSFTQGVANKLSGIVTLNQSVIETGPVALFLAEDEKESDDSIVTKLVSVIKGIVYAFAGSSSFGKA